MVSSAFTHMRWRLVSGYGALGVRSSDRARAARPSRRRCPRESLVFSASAPRRQHAGSGRVGDRVAAAAAQDDRAANRDHRADQRPDDVHPVAVQSPLTSAGPNERAGFIEAPLTGAAHSPASAM